MRFVEIDVFHTILVLPSTKRKFIVEIYTQREARER